MLSNQQIKESPSAEEMHTIVQQFEVEQAKIAESRSVMILMISFLFPSKYSRILN